MHQVTPAVLLVDWVCFPPWSRASYRAALGWLAFPLVYLAYSLSRGAAVDWYPYPFLDPRHPGGYGRVAAFAVVLAVVMALLAVAVNAIGRTRAGSGRRNQRGWRAAPASTTSRRRASDQAASVADGSPVSTSRPCASRSRPPLRAAW